MEKTKRDICCLVQEREKKKPPKQSRVWKNKEVWFSKLNAFFGKDLLIKVMLFLAHFRYQIGLFNQFRPNLMTGHDQFTMAVLVIQVYQLHDIFGPDELAHNRGRNLI